MGGKTSLDRSEDFRDGSTCPTPHSAVCMWREITQEPCALGWLARGAVCAWILLRGAAPAQAGGVGGRPGAWGQGGSGGQGVAVGWV